jgi:acetyltransferase
MRDQASPFVLRHAQPNDLLGIAELFVRLSDRSRYLRYFQPLAPSPAHSQAEARRMVLHTTRRGITLVIALPPDAGGEAIAVAELVRSPDALDQGELAMLVRDDYQGQGLGRLLGRQLVALARRLGLATIHADILPENRASLRLLGQLGVPYSLSFDSGLLHAVLQLQSGAATN